MTACADPRLPEEIELEHKLAELGALRLKHAEARETFLKLEGEIARFQKIYQRTLGRRIAELERLEVEIARQSGYPEYVFEAAEEALNAQSLDEREDEAEVREIKALYREVAKAIHPDRAGSEQNRADRHELMTKANQAYAEDDRATLQAILRDWQGGEESVPGSDVAAGLIRAIRAIARVREEIQEVQARIAELKGSYICRLKLRVDTDLAKGSDLFADLCAAADVNIARARKKLAALKGEKEEVSSPGKRQTIRSICFPMEDCGLLFTRQRNSANFSQWKHAGVAKGVCPVGADQAVRLDIKGRVAAKLKLLGELDPGDLQALFVYEATDRDLDGILHFAGLEELYLSGGGLTDTALGRIASLSNLKRLYLYQTAITDFGLVHLQRLSRLVGLTSSGNDVTAQGLLLLERSIPGLKVVNIPVSRFSRT